MMNKTLLTFCVIFQSYLLIGQHTFSIVAIDPETREVGSAGATCLSSSECGGCGGAIIISGLSPDKGAMNSQASVCIPNVNLELGIDLMNQDQIASDILSDVLAQDPCNAGNTLNRQYGIITIDAQDNLDVSTYTGEGALSYASARKGIDYAIQGNILIGPEVLDSMEAQFIRSEGEPLAVRLMRALQGANIPGADSRCLNEGVSSRSAFIRVAKPGDTEGDYYIDINIPFTGFGVEPIDVLQDEFNLLGLSPIKELTDPIPEQFTIYSDRSILTVENVSDKYDDYTIQLFTTDGKLIINKKIENKITRLTVPENGSRLLFVSIFQKGKLILSKSIPIVE